MDLTLNGERRGPLELELNADGEPFLAPAQLRSLLDGYLRPALLDAVGAQPSYPADGQLPDLGVNLSYDAASLSLRIDVEPSSMPVRNVGVIAPPPEGAGERRIRNAPFAATLGLNVGYDLTNGADSSGVGYTDNSLGLGFTPTLRVAETVAEGNLALKYGTGGSEAALTAAQVMKDFPEMGMRLRGGIVSVSAESFQASQRMYGFSFGRDESLPGAARERAALDEEFLLRNAAEVTVSVNGVATRRLRLLPGNYRFSDLPLASGLNDVSVVIAEQGMEARTVRIGVPFDAALLGPGRTDYAVSLGSVSLDASQPYGAARFALGLHRSVQVGANLEVDADSILTGGTALAATRFGTFGLEGAVSSSYSSAVGLESPSSAIRGYWRFSQPRDRSLPLMGAAADYRFAGFAPPNYRGAGEDSMNVSAQISQSLPRRAGTVSLSGNGTFIAAELSDWSATLGFNLPLGRACFLSLSGGGEWNREEAFAPRVSAVLVMAQAGKGVVSYGQSFANGTDGENLSVGLGQDGRRTVNVYGQGLLIPGTDRALELSGTAQNDLVSLGLSGNYTSADEGDVSVRGASVSAMTTLAFADGVFAATSAPGSALAILAPAKELRGQRVELRPLGGMPVTSKSGRPVAAGGLAPYSSYTAGIELPQSPPDERPDPASVSLSPAYRSISVIRVGIAPSIAVRGLLVDAAGAPVVNLSGGIVDAEGISVPFTGTFTDEEGVFECYGLAPGPMSIRWDDGRISSFEVPRSKSGILVYVGSVLAQAEAEGVEP